jgi:hypothetical protein
MPGLRAGSANEIALGIPQAHRVLPAILPAAGIRLTECSQTSKQKGQTMDQETKTVALGEILNTNQLREVKRILNSTADTIEQVQRLKDYFGTFREDLERQEILPEYLAYVVAYRLDSPEALVKLLQRAGVL